MEGNAASDTMHDDGGEDDMLGGTGPTTNSSQLGPLSDEDRATALPDRTDVSTAPKRTVPLGTDLPLPTEEVPLGDEMYGGEGADVMLGDNGIIIRPLQAEQWITLRYDRFVDHIGDVAPRHPTERVNPGDEPSGSRIDRSVEMLDGAPGLVAGSDLMFGGPGDDDMYGQFDDTQQTTPAIGDEMYGEEGEDAMAGDQGVFDNRVLAAGSQTHIEPKEPFIDDDIFIDGTLFREFISAESVGDEWLALGCEGGRICFGHQVSVDHSSAPSARRHRRERLTGLDPPFSLKRRRAIEASDLRHPPQRCDSPAVRDHLPEKQVLRGNTVLRHQRPFR